FRSLFAGASVSFLNTSAWMKLTRSAKAPDTCWITSTTGPHTRLWQNRGVPMTNTVGLPFASATSSEIACIEHGGVLVQYGLTPRWLSTVGVGTETAFAPGPGPSRCSTAG